MNDTDPASFAQLFEQMLEGDIDDTARARLIGLLESDPALCNEVRRHLGISAALEHLSYGEDQDAFVRMVTEHVFHLGGEGDESFVEKVIGQLPVRKRPWRPVAVAALLLLSAVAGFLMLRGGEKGPVLAKLKTIDAQGQVVSSREVRGGFEHVLKEGLLRLDFGNGAIVAIEGPADFEVVSAAVMRLGSGKLNAWCPQSAHGFEVITANAKVTDRGTSFGVSATSGGSTDFIVLDGIIDVSQGSDTRRLTEGEALRSSGSGGLESVAFQAEKFSRTWPLASGILSASGSVKPAPPATPEQLALMEDDESVLVIPEKRSVPFDKPLEVELAAPGEISLQHLPQRQTVAARRELRLRSFLIRYNPVGRPAGKFQRFEGQVTFDRPVLAICASGPVLEASDAVFATGPWRAAEGEVEFRGIDLDQPESRADQVRLSADRHTVSIIFNAGTSTDDLRVIVEEDSGAGRLP